MLVRIGPYNNYCSFFKGFITKAELRYYDTKSPRMKKIADSDLLYDIALNLDHFIDIIWYDRWYYNLFRGTGVEKIRIDNYDTWNMDTTLAKIILPCLKQLKATKHGAPDVDDKYVPDELKRVNAPPTENDWDTDDNYFKRWDYVLDEMIWAFDHIVDTSWEDALHTGVRDVYSEQREDGLYEMKRGPNHTHKFDIDTYHKIHKRIQNGTMLFGFYYSSLWD